MMSAYLADLIVSGIALAGVLALSSVSMDRDTQSNGLAARFRFLLYVITVLLAARIIFWSSGLSVFGWLALVAASLIPIAALLLVEGLLRRHAPAFVKFSVSIGAIVLIVAAFLPASVADPWRIIGLAIYQLVGLSVAGGLLYVRDRSTLSGAENMLINRIGISLLLILPLLVTDFRGLFEELPVRMGGLGILALCWLGLDDSFNSEAWLSSLRRLLVLLTLGLAIGVAIGYVLGQGPVGIVQAAAISTAGGILVAMVSDAFRARVRRRRKNLLHALAYDKLTNRNELIQRLQAYPLVEGAILLKDKDLEGFDVPALSRVFQGWPVMRSRDVGDKAMISGFAGEQLTSLFVRFQANYLVMTSLQPFRLLALNMPTVASAPTAEVELALLQKIAALLPDTEADNG